MSDDFSFSSYRQRKRQSGFWAWGLLALLTVAIAGYFFIVFVPSPSGSGHEAVIRSWCQKNLHSSDFEIVEISKPRQRDGEEQVMASIRTRNQFGGQVLADWVFGFKNGKMVSAREAIQGEQW